MARTRPWRWLPVFGALLLGACESNILPQPGPEGHTVVRDGVAHAPGLSEPMENCAQCHGPTLEGGAAGEPSCTACHGVVW